MPDRLVRRQQAGPWHLDGGGAGGFAGIVPPESARPLAMRIRDAVLHEPAVGHIGMVAGARAEAALWRPLLAWVRGL